MKVKLIGLALGATMAVACTSSTKVSETQRSYLIKKTDAVKVTRLALRTAAIAGRYGVLPKGADMKAASQPKCPYTGVVGKIKTSPVCNPDMAGGVSCTITTEYGCEEATGKIVDSAKLDASGMTYSLVFDAYKEGTDAMGWIKYDGKTSNVKVQANGSADYTESITATARSAGDTSDTTVKFNATMGVAVATGSLKYNGKYDLDITGRGLATLELKDVEFGDGACKSSPVSGTIDMALVGLEKAVFQINSCGNITLVHYNGDAEGTKEDLTSDEVMSAFGTAITEATTFRAGSTNVEKSGGLIHDKYCVPYVKGVTHAMTALVGYNADATDFAGKPVSECLEFLVLPPAQGSLNVVKHSLVSDQTGLGLFGDPTQNKVHFMQVAVAVTTTTVVAPAAKLIYFQTLTPGHYGDTQSQLEALGAGALTAYCDPANPIATACPILSYPVVIADHMGLGLLVNPAGTPPGYWFAHIIP